MELPITHKLWNSLPTKVLLTKQLLVNTEDASLYPEICVALTLRRVFPGFTIFLLL